MNDRINDSGNLADAIKGMEKELEGAVGLTTAGSIMGRARRYFDKLNLDVETWDRFYLNALKRAYDSRNGK